MADTGNKSSLTACCDSGLDSAQAQALVTMGIRSQTIESSNIL